MYTYFFDSQALFRRILNPLTVFLSSVQDQGLKVTIFPSLDELLKFLSGNCETVMVSNTGKGVESIFWEYGVQYQDGEQWDKKEINEK